MDLGSCLYECQIMHHRLSPVRNRFVYKAFFFLLDLDEMDEAARRLLFLSRGGPNVFSFRESDHLRQGSASTQESVLAYIRTQGIGTTIARVRLLTNLRTMGHIFNPVSFYFCDDADGRPVCVVAEVGNTFGEMKPFLLRSQRAREGLFEEAHTKYFYVSPFIDLDATFTFRLQAPGDRLSLHIDDRERGRTMLVTSVQGERKELTNARLFWYALRFPFMTVRILALIHFQAFRLYRKGLPYHKKDSHQHLQREVFHVHHE